MNRENWKSQMYRVFGILFLLPILLGCFANSPRFKPGHRSIVFDLDSTMADPLMVDQHLIDSLQILRFADSLEVFLYESVRIDRDRLPDIPGNPISGNLIEVVQGEELYLTLLLQNLSSADLRIPKRLTGRPCEYLLGDQFGIGITDLEGNPLKEYPRPGYSSSAVFGQEVGSDYFQVIRSHELLLAIDSLAVFECHDLPNLPVGEYIISCFFQSIWWEPGEPPVWIGSIGEYSFPLRIVPTE